MIPVLAIPVLNRGDLLLRCVKSIDYPVAELVIVNNGNDITVRSVIGQLENEMIVKAHKPERNLGVSASWNLVMREHPEAAYWLFVGNDIRFTPGDLKKMDGFIAAHPDYVTTPANQGHSLFAVTRHGRELIGEFDENFYPAYLEDSDHMRRVSLANAKWQDVPDVHAVHGEAPSWGSHTIYADPQLRARNEVTHRNLFLYYQRKWGGPPGAEKFTHPYNDSSLTWRDWRLDEKLQEANRRTFDGE